MKAVYSSVVHSLQKSCYTQLAVPLQRKVMPMPFHRILELHSTVLVTSRMHPVVKCSGNHTSHPHVPMYTTPIGVIDVSCEKSDGHETTQSRRAGMVMTRPAFKSHRRRCFPSSHHRRQLSPSTAPFHLPPSLSNVYSPRPRRYRHYYGVNLWTLRLQLNL